MKIYYICESCQEVFTKANWAMKRVSLQLMPCARIAPRSYILQEK